MNGSNDMRGSRWPNRLAWLALYWLAGVATMTAVAFGLRFLMKAVGLSL